MPLPTSDFRNPVCLEMRTLKTDQVYNSFSEVDVKQKNINNNNGDLASMDSSDTFASCTTHPFNSQGDLTSDIVDPSCVIDSNLYVNPLDKSGDNSPVTPAPGRTGGVKKSASGDTALRSLGTSPMEEAFRGFGPLDRGSRVSLNDSPLPKNRRTRFQQSGRPRTRFGDAFERDSQESLETKRKKTSFIPTRGLASATRIINQHLFGLQSLSGSRSGKNSGSKSSLSVDSIDSRVSPQLEHHRRSKSILKKSDSSGNRNADPESERLISDNMSGYEIGSGSEYSPNKRLSSPPMRHRALSQKTLAKNLPLFYQQDSEKNRTLKSQLFLLDDIINKEKHSCKEPMFDSNKLKECSDSVGDVPLYICPPPPPMDDNSPNEETRLLLHPTVVVPSPRQPGNSISKGPTPSS
ncbi:uncharacterized protein BDFB_007783 [Asbolus verrucosus]|uniref:Uncharacterized protein n=1 Tax=Asbolus verrucosus TaxID=1661398 RepID=A0A482VMY6_ASBVE|nr:uncharacterized protein BDFB_007783 [Asbolus verrucosus]